MKKIPVTFISVWDGGITLKSRALYDPKSKEVDVLEIYEGDNVEVLERQFIILPDGTEAEAYFNDKGILVANCP